ncbi:hypothetical protein K2173_008923 [Erythroxylum novogranatense]|uniref:Tricalbin-3-like n=1 Tax=Erythroxylum novogranatense TaxID=1862640 RepID=A0AAV8TSA0_9ROSI|nr:hypothetical protein K2173_008923 [Erythroxylum novogranatense]
MILQSSALVFYPQLCPCKCLIQDNTLGLSATYPLSKRRRRKRKSLVLLTNLSNRNFRRRFSFRACGIPNDGKKRSVNVEFANSTRKGAKSVVLQRVSSELGSQDPSHESSSASSLQVGSNFSSFQEDPIVDKLRTQLGVIHPMPSPPVNRTVFGLFIFFFFGGVVFDKLWTSRKKGPTNMENGQRGTWPQVPSSFSLFLEKDLQRKESVEWVNMVLGKLWKVYRGGIENWLVGLLQPVIDNLKKPDYVERVEIKQFSLGDEPLSVRNVERRTSRRVNDLQYQIGLRYTGGARMLLMLSLKFSLIPIVVPVGVRDFDIDGELWVKLRLITTEPWVGAVTWAFVSLPKIKFELSPFRLFNLMAIPVLSMFLTKLLTEDLPLLFVRPKKIVLDFQKGKAVGPVAIDFRTGAIQEGNSDFVGELSVTLVDARKLSYFFYGKTDPYVVLRLGDQTIRSKKNSQTTVIGPPGEPIWNQDFHMLVVNPRRQKLLIQVNDSLGFADLTIGMGEVDLASLQDTVPADRIVVLQGGWGLFRKRSAGELLLRLTYKAYVEDEEDDRSEMKSTDAYGSDDEFYEIDESQATYESSGIGKGSSSETDKESFMDVLAALIVSEEFQGIVASETGINKLVDDLPGAGTTASKSDGPIAKPKPSEFNNSSEDFGGSVLLWFAIITSIAVLIALNIGGSSIFNP